MGGCVCVCGGGGGSKSGVAWAIEGRERGARGEIGRGAEPWEFLLAAAWGGQPGTSESFPGISRSGTFFAKFRKFPAGLLWYCRHGAAAAVRLMGAAGSRWRRYPGRHDRVWRVGAV